MLAALIVGDNKHAYWTKPTDQNNPNGERRLLAKGGIRLCKRFNPQLF